MTSPSPGREGRRRRRRPKRKPTAPPSAAAVLSEASAEVTAEPAEVPMTPAEIARMKVTLRFLREHRHTLKLKVNAAEDLLLNGRREPTHRGLCQHLLSKLDRGRVISASERLPPAEATELLAGIVRFAPEIPYIVRFLQCVKASADRAQTAAALTQALERLDLRETSGAQLRDLLLLIVDIFPRSELPVFVMSLLERPEFREAVERSIDGFPESLAQLIGPLGHLQGYIAQRPGGRRRREEPRADFARVLEGAASLLEAAAPNLAELPESSRRRLLDVASDARLIAHNGTAADALVALFRGVHFGAAPARAAALVKLAGALLGAGREKQARQLLADGLEGAPPGEPARRWLELLDGARFGDIALPRRHARDTASARGAADVPKDRWLRAWHVPTQRDVLVRFAGSEDVSGHAELRRRALVPGVAALVAVETRSEGRPPYVAVAWHGPMLEGRAERGDVARRVLVEWCRELCLLLHAVALTGLELPDAAAKRFSVDDAHRLWLSDLWGARDGGASAVATHLELARRACLELLGAPGPSGVLEAATMQQLYAALTG